MNNEQFKMKNEKNTIMKTERENILGIKSYAFAVRIVKLNIFLIEKKEFSLSKQIVRSGTAIGALLREAEYGQSKLDFISKMSIALKEANETGFWLCLLKDTGFIAVSEFESMNNDCLELIRILISSIKTAKSNLENEK